MQLPSWQVPYTWLCLVFLPTPLSSSSHFLRALHLNRTQCRFLNLISFFSPHPFQALVISCVLYKRTEHSRGSWWQIIDRCSPNCSKEGVCFERSWHYWQTLAWHANEQKSVEPSSVFRCFSSLTLRITIISPLIVVTRCAPQSNNWSRAMRDESVHSDA